MKSDISSYRGGLRPYPLRFHVGKAGADAKVNQHGLLGVAYHGRHPISTVPVARITAHATVASFLQITYFIYLSKTFAYWNNLVNVISYGLTQSDHITSSVYRILNTIDSTKF
jgi:hypothetical protein